jgi:uncharacterized protein (DUF433 family)
MRRDLSKGSSIANVVKFRDPSGRVAELLENGMSVEDVVKLFKDLLVGTQRVEGNVYLNEGINFIWRAVTGQPGLTYFGGNSCIGVGDGATAENPSQTGLLGTNKTYKQVDSGYPVVSGTQVTFRATFGPDVANHGWKEWTVANGCNDNAVNINRRVADLGTKTPDSTWVLEVTLVIT